MWDTRTTHSNVSGRTATTVKRDRYLDLNSLLVQKCNGNCVDCDKPRPTWASVNLGIFICTECAGIHRSLGTHITFVQSTKMDKWKDEWFENCRVIGNGVGRAYYEHSLPKDFIRPRAVPVGGDCLRAQEASDLKAFIRNKYIFVFTYAFLSKKMFETQFRITKS